MTTIDSSGRHRQPAGAPASQGGQFRAQSTPGAAAQLRPDPEPTTARRVLDEFATYLATNDVEAEMNEVAANCVAAAGLGLPHPGDQSDEELAFWREYEPDAPHGSPEWAFQTIGKQLGELEQWPSAGDLWESTYAPTVRAAGGVVDAFEEDPDDAMDRLHDELDRVAAVDDSAGTVRVSAGLLARAVAAEWPAAAAIEVSNGAADDGEMRIEVDAVYDEHGAVLASLTNDPDIAEPFLDYSVSLDRDFDVLRAMSTDALERVPLHETFPPTDENHGHFIHVDSTIQATGPTL